MEKKYPLGLSLTGVAMCVALGGLFLLILVAGQLVIRFLYAFEQPLPFTLGLLLGSVLSFVKVVLLEKSIKVTVDLEGDAAKNRSSLHAVLRYFLTILMVLPVVLFPKVFGLFGTILGILSLQLSAYVASYWLRDRTL